MTAILVRWSTSPSIHDSQRSRALGNRDISYIRASRLIRPFDRHSSQQLRIDFVFRMPATGVRLLVDRLDPVSSQFWSHR